jgi:general stress protein 26
MSIDIHDKAAVEARMWRDLKENRFGMLGAVGLPIRHFNPMTAFAEPESAKIWFYTAKDTDLAQAALKGAPAMFMFMTRDQELQACIGGEIRTVFDALHRDKYWSPMVSAWFPKGKDDPSLTLLCLECADAEVWISEKGSVKVAWEIAKANLTGSPPHVGEHAALTLG